MEALRILAICFLVPLWFWFGVSAFATVGCPRFANPDAEGWKLCWACAWRRWTEKK